MNQSRARRAAARMATRASAARCGRADCAPGRPPSSSIVITAPPPVDDLEAAGSCSRVSRNSQPASCSPRTTSKCCGSPALSASRASRRVYPDQPRIMKSGEALTGDRHAGKLGIDLEPGALVDGRCPGGDLVTRRPGALFEHPSSRLTTGCSRVSSATSCRRRAGWIISSKGLGGATGMLCSRRKMRRSQRLGRRWKAKSLPESRRRSPRTSGEGPRPGAPAAGCGGVSMAAV